MTPTVTATDPGDNTAYNFLIHWASIGLAVFMLGLFVLSSRSAYTHLVEALLLLPGVILMLTAPGRRLMAELAPQLLPLLLLLTYAALRTLSDWQYEHYHSLIYILEAGLFCATVAMLFLWNRGYLESLLFLSCLAVSAFCAAHIAYFYLVLGYPLNAPLLEDVRVAGLRNPLEAGMIATTIFFLLLGFQLRPGIHNWKYYCGWLAMAIVLIFIILLQRRTAYVAIGGGLLLALWLTGHRMAKYTLILIGLSAIALLLIMPEAYTNRGFSYRPQIWTNALEQSRDALLFGHGILADVVTLENDEIIGMHAHNIHLGTLYSLGLIGLLLWLYLWLPTAITALRQRVPNEQAIYILPLIAAMLYGCFELSHSFIRINERWFIIWLPISLMICYRLSRKASTNRIEKP